MGEAQKRQKAGMRRRGARRLSRLPHPTHPPNPCRCGPCKVLDKNMKVRRGSGWPWGGSDEEWQL